MADSLSPLTNPLNTNEGRKYCLGWHKNQNEDRHYKRCMHAPCCLHVLDLEEPDQKQSDQWNDAKINSTGLRVGRPKEGGPVDPGSNARKSLRKAYELEGKLHGNGPCRFCIRLHHKRDIKPLPTAESQHQRQPLNDPRRHHQRHHWRIPRMHQSKFLNQLKIRLCPPPPMSLQLARAVFQGDFPCLQCCLHQRSNTEPAPPPLLRWPIGPMYKKG